MYKRAHAHVYSVRRLCTQFEHTRAIRQTPCHTIHVIRIWKGTAVMSTKSGRRKNTTVKRQKIIFKEKTFQIPSLRKQTVNRFSVLKLSNFFVLDCFLYLFYSSIICSIITTIIRKIILQRNNKIETVSNSRKNIWDGRIKVSMKSSRTCSNFSSSYVTYNGQLMFVHYIRGNSDIVVIHLDIR